MPQESYHPARANLRGYLYEPCLYQIVNSCTIALFNAGTAEYRQVQTAYLQKMFSEEKG
jgi:hypothetical protein